MLQVMKQFWMEEEGVTAIEYGLIAALVALVIIAAVVTAGSNLNILWTRIGTCLSNATTGLGCP